MSVPVRFVDKEGNTVKEFSSLKVAAAEAGCTASTLGWRIRHKSVFNGLYAEYMSIKYTEVKENNYNLSVSTYVEKEDTREVIDIKVLNEEIKRIVSRENELRLSIDEIIKDIEGDSNE